MVNYAKHYFNYERTLKHLLYPFKVRYVFLFLPFFPNFFQTLAYMLIWSSKVVTWVWFQAWAILLAKNNARSWEVAHFSQSIKWLASWKIQMLRSVRKTELFLGQPTLHVVRSFIFLIGIFFAMYLLMFQKMVKNIFIKARFEQVSHSIYLPEKFY